MKTLFAESGAISLVGLIVLRDIIVGFGIGVVSLFILLLIRKYKTIQAPKK